MVRTIVVASRLKQCLVLVPQSHRLGLEGAASRLPGIVSRKARSMVRQRTRTAAAWLWYGIEASRSLAALSPDHRPTPAASDRLAVPAYSTPSGVSRRSTPNAIDEARRATVSGSGKPPGLHPQVARSAIGLTRGCGMEAAPVKTA